MTPEQVHEIVKAIDGTSFCITCLSAAIWAQTIFQILK